MKQFFPSTLSRYLARTYTVNFCGLLLGLLGIIYLFDTVELLRRGTKHEDISLFLIFQMGLYKLPEVGQMVLPFAVLFSAILTFWHLTRRHELVVVRAAGLSVWQFLGPIIGVGLLIGVLQITVINPLGALSLARFENLESSYLKRQESLISLSQQGLWLRQSTENDGYVILHASGVKMPEWILQNTISLFFSNDDTFLRRIDAKEAVLEPGEWNFRHATINAPHNLPEEADMISLATNLTAQEIEDSFASAETIPFWRLKTFIRTMEATGFNATSLKIHFQRLLAQPLMFAAMILLAASVSLRPPRLRGTATLVIIGVIIGFIVFFISSFLQALGASGQLPPVLAAWSPPAICFLLGVGAMMILEDG